MKITQLRTFEGVHMGVDLAKSIIDGSQKGARFPGLSMELYENVGVKITLNRQFAIVPWSNIIVALGTEVQPQPAPVVNKVDREHGSANS
jgi:hypothetical protein